MALVLTTTTTSASAQLEFFTRPDHGQDQLYIKQANSQVYRALPNDAFTAQRLGHVPGQSVSSLDDATLRSMNLTLAPDPVPTLLPNYNIPDDIMAKELQRIHLLSCSWPIFYFKNLGLLQNPALARDWARNVSILSYRGARWVDVNNYFVELDDNSTQIVARPKFQLGDKDSKYGALGWVEDIRLLPHPDPANGTVFLSYTQITKMTHPLPQGHMSLSIMALDRSANKYEVLPSTRDKGWRLDWAEKLKHVGHLPSVEKNWSPFIAPGGELHFVYSYHPFRVLAVDRFTSVWNETQREPDNTAHVSLVSEMRCLNTWEYGQIRGGTPALIVRGEFLTFFHSRTRLKGSKFETYFMGALTFSAMPPHRLLRQSRVPILVDEFYTGPWAGMRTIDYIVFPLGFFVHDDGNSITLSLGQNDKQGFIVKMHVDALFASLLPLNCSNNDNRF